LSFRSVYAGARHRGDTKISLKRIGTVAVLLLIALYAAQAQNKIQLKIASVAPSRSPWDIEQRALAQEWSEITGGLVTVTFYDTYSLGGEKSVIQKFRSVRPGQKAPLDGAIFTTVGLHELAPDASIYTLSLPFLIRSQNELDAVLDRFGPALIAKYKKAGFEMIAWSNVGWLSFFTKDSYATLPELKKIKIASAGLDSPVLGDGFRAAGFSIEDLGPGKLLQSLKSAGGVRGYFSVHLFAYVTGLSKATKYSLDAKLCPVMAGFVMSNDSWARVPEQYRPAMIAAAKRMKARLDASLETTDREYVEKMKADGVHMIVPTAAELAAWDAEFARDIDKVNRSVPGSFDIALYRDIQNFLLKTRK
jgi:TRAP-type C4-dicarboxylate transport system substrate-binding protein